MSSSHVDRNTTPLHVPHYQGAVNHDSLVVAAGKDSAGSPMFRNPNPEHAVTNGYKREVWHELNAVPTFGTDFFQNTGFTTVDLPGDYHEVWQSDLRLDFKNNDGSDMSFNSLPSNLFDKIEVVQGSRTIETIDEIPLWLDQIFYPTKEEHERYSDTTRIDPTTRGVSFSITAGSTASDPPCTIPFRNVITACGIATSTLAEPIQYKYYSAGRTGSDVVNCTDFQVTNFKLWAKEKRMLDSEMAKRVHISLDYRYLKPKSEKRSIALTSGSTTDTILQKNEETSQSAWVARHV